MKPRYGMAAGMFSLVLLAGGISAAVFYLEGSQAAVYALGAVFPLLVMAGYVWVNRTVGSSGTSRTEFEQRKARQVGEQFRDIWQLAEGMESAYPAVVSENEWSRLERQAQDLEEHGIRFDLESGSFSVETGSLGSLEEINRLENEVAELESWLESGFVENARAHASEIQTALGRLDGLVTVPGSVDPATIPEPSNGEESTDWRDAGEALEQCYTAAETAISNGCDALEAAAASTESAETETVNRSLSDARRHSTNRQFERAVDALLDARSVVEQDVTQVFGDQRSTLQSLLQTARRKPFDDYLGPSFHETLERYGQEIRTVDDALEITELDDIERECRETCLDVIEELQSELSAVMRTLDGADVPEGWYERPDAAGGNYLRNLQTVQELATFEQEFDAAVEELLQALDTVKPKASVISGFDRVETVIDEKLRSSGVVTADDLPVSELEEQFLGLYYRKQMGSVEFDPDVPQLRAPEGGQTHTLTVVTTFPEGGVERELGVTVDGPTTQTERQATPLVAEFTFEELPYGEYTVQIEPQVDSYAAIERTVLVDSETELDIDIEQQSLREQVCDGIDIETDTVLRSLSDRFDDRFEEEGYVSSEMSFPVDSEYLPCLVATWAEREGHEAMREDGGVIAVDRELITKEIENVIRYNLSAGEGKTFEELRSNFLSAPVPDATIERLASNSSEQEVISIDRAELTKTEDR